MAEQQTAERIEGIGVEAVVPVVPNDVTPINYEVALRSFPEDEQQEILALANKIDVRRIENVMSYGSVAMKKTFEQCGRFLKDERGSQADQRVIAQVIELSKRASESYDDFNLVLQEPGLFHKLWLKFTSGSKNPRVKKLQNTAITSYKLLSELKASCDSWLDMLKKAYGEIDYAALNDIEAIGLLEKYIIAGKMAEQRIEQEIIAIEQEHQSTGLQKYKLDYEKLQEGYNIFQITMANLEKSRVMYQLSLGQLALIKRSNRNVQISIHTQVDNSMALIGQQLRNAVLDAKTQEVLEGQKAIARLNDELIKEVSKTVGLTARETESLIYAGFYNMDAAKEAISTVISSCQEIEKVAEEMLPRMKADMTEIDGLIKELEPYIGNAETLKIENGKPANAGITKGLDF